MTDAAPVPAADDLSLVGLVELLTKAEVLTPTALNLRAVIDLEDEQAPERWEQLGRFFGRISRSSAWWIGDWLNFGEAAWGERYAQASDATGLHYGTLTNYAWVARQVPKSRRREGLSFSAHAEVAPLEPAAQKEWLKRAEEEGWASRDLRKAIREAGEEPPEREQPAWSKGDGELPVGDVAAAARGVWHAAQPNGDGSYQVAAEPMARLAAALGEEA